MNFKTFLKCSVTFAPPFNDPEHENIIRRVQYFCVRLPEKLEEFAQKQKEQRLRKS